MDKKTNVLAVVISRTILLTCLLLGLVDHLLAKEVLILGGPVRQPLLQEFLQDHGHILHKSHTSSNPYFATPDTSIDVAIINRTFGIISDATVKNFVLNGGLLITEAEGAEWALNSANLLEADDVGETFVSGGDSIYFESPGTGIAQGVSSPYIDPPPFFREGTGRTERFRNFTNIGDDVKILARRGNGEPAILAGRAGKGTVLIIGYLWGQMWNYANSDTRGLILNAIDYKLSIQSSLSPSITEVYTENFDQVADGALPPGWQKFFGPGVREVRNGWFTDVSEAFTSYSFYNYADMQFGDAIYAFDYLVSDRSLVQGVAWKHDLNGEWGTSYDLIFRTSTLIPPSGHTRLRRWKNGEKTILADVDREFIGSHRIQIEDGAGNIKVFIDEELVFDVVDISPISSSGHFVLIGGDRGGGDAIDNIVIAVDDAGITPESNLIPDIALSSNNLSFGSVALGTSTPRSLTFRNEGDAALLVHSLTITSGSDSGLLTQASSNTSLDFKIENNLKSLILAAGVDSTITINFTPHATGDIVGELIVENNDPDESRIVIPLSGTGVGTVGFESVENEITQREYNGGAQSGVWADYDGDGYPDLFMARANQTNQLFHNEQTRFKDVSTSSNLNDIRSGIGAAWGDYDNDGFPDLYVSAENHPNNDFDPTDRFYRNNRDGTFTEIGSSVGLARTGNSRLPVWGDYDNDGDLDLYVNDSALQNSLYRNEGTGNFVDVTNDLGVDGAQNKGGSSAWVDYDNDGDLDLHVTQWDVSDLLFRNDGDNVFTDVATELNLAVGGKPGTPLWADFNGDGYWDVYLTGVVPPHRLFLRTGGFASSFNETASSLNPEDGGGPAAYSDYDNDGDLDIYVAHGDPLDPIQTQKNHKLYEYDRLTGRYLNVSSVLNGNVGGYGGQMAWVDYNLDGQTDLFVPVGAYENERHHFYISKGTQNNWLTLRLQGNSSAKNSFGARIKVISQGKTQIRQVDSFSGVTGALGTLVHFGVGDAFTIDRVEMRWPSGEQQVLENVSTNQIVDVAEPDRGPQIMDQVFSPGAVTGASGVSTDIYKAQSFTAGYTGKLVGVDFIVSRDALGSYLIVDIRPVKNGKPIVDDSLILGQTQIPSVDIPETGDVIHSDFSEKNIILTKGQQYAMVFRPEVGGGHYTFPTSSSGYSGGASFAKNLVSRPSWWELEHDMFFRTYVLPSDPSSPPGQVGIPQNRDIVLSLDGAGDFMQVDGDFTFSQTNQITLEAWVNVAGSKDQNGVISSGLVYRMLVNADMHPFWNAGTHTDISGGYAFALNTWHHYSMVIEGSRDAKVYVDGNLVATNSAGVPAVLSDRATFLIGTGESGSVHNFSGKIDEVRIWNRSLAQEEIKSRMTRSLIGNEDGLVGYWDFNSLTSDGKVPDLSINHYNGRLFGDANIGIEPSTSPDINIDLLTNLVFWLPFNDTTKSTISDASSNGLVGTRFGGASSLDVPAPGADNFSLEIKSENDVLSFEHNDKLSLTGSFVLSGYVKIPTSSTQVTLLGKISGASINYNLVIVDGRPVFQVSDSKSTSVQSPEALSPNVWHHVAGVRDRESVLLRLYVDGVEVASIPDQTTEQIINTSPVFAGYALGVDGGKGVLLDDIQIYDRLLSPEKVKQLAARIFRAPLLALENESLQFGQLAVNGTTQKMLRVYNRGDDMLAFSLTTTGDFYGPSGILSVLPGEYLDLEIEFSSSQTGHQEGTLSLSSNDRRGIRDVRLVGEIIPAPALATLPSDTLEFPKVVGVGTRDTTQFLVKNPGVGDLIIAQIVSSPDVFKAFPSSLTLAANQDTIVSIVFSPTDSADIKGQVTLFSNALGLPEFILPINASSRFFPTLVLHSERDIVFPDTIGVGDVDIYQAQVANVGLSTLEINVSETSDPNYAIVDSVFSIAPGDSVDLKIQFQPQSVGVQRGKVFFSTNDPEHPTVELSVTGIGERWPVLHTTPMAIDFGTIGVGQDKSKLITLENKGDADLRIEELGDLAIRDDPLFSVARPSFPIILRKGSSKNLTIIFRPTPAFLGVSTSDLEIWSNDPRRRPLTIPLKGRAVPTGAPPEVSISTPQDSSVVVWDLEATYIFSGTALNGDGGRIDSLAWVSDVGGVMRATTSADSINFEYPIRDLPIGDQTITLKVWDTEGDSSSAAISLSVQGLQPIAQIDTVSVKNHNFDSERRIVFALFSTDRISFAGHGYDQDEFGEEIVSHLWTFKSTEDQSIRESPRSNKARFSVPAQRLGIGTFWVYYRVTDEEGQESKSDSIKVIVRKDVGRAIIVAGGGYLGDNQEAFFNYTSSVTNSTYNMLINRRRYSREAVEYLNPISDWGPANREAIQVTDSEVTVARFKQSFDNAKTHNLEDGIPLLIFLAGHGGDGVFFLNDTEELKGGDFKEWLDDLNAEKIRFRSLEKADEIYSGEVVIVVDFCFSRTFLEQISGPGRIVIGSSSKTVSSVIKGKSFGSFFFDGTAKGQNVLESFNNARDLIQGIFDQEPYIDVNGDGVPIYGEDGQRNLETEGDEKVARNVYVGGEFITLSRLRPEIYSAQLLQDNGVYTISVEADDKLSLSYTIVPEAYNSESESFGNLKSGLIEPSSSTEEGHKIYAEEWTPDTSGKYTILVQGIDGVDNVAGHRTVSVSIQNQPKTSDFNGDGKVDFSDFIAFAAQFGKKIGDEGWDVRLDLDGDGEIGFGDFISFATAFGK
jgi:enediyne biosynthesis protein E4